MARGLGRGRAVPGERDRRDDVVRSGDAAGRNRLLVPGSRAGHVRGGNVRLPRCRWSSRRGANERRMSMTRESTTGSRKGHVMSRFGKGLLAASIFAGAALATRTSAQIVINEIHYN